jgi:hypothetical protein
MDVHTAALLLFHRTQSEIMDELLYYVGLAAVSGVALYVTLGTFNFVYLYFLQGGMNLKKKYGEWAGMWLRGLFDLLIRG